MNPLSGVFGEAWELYKRHWTHLFAIAFIVFAILAAVGVVLALVVEGWVGGLIGAVIYLVGTFWVYGALVQAVKDVRDGRADLSVSDTFSLVYPKLGTLFIAGILLGIAVGIGFVLIIVPGLVLLTIWIAVIPAIVLENRGIGESFGRSWELVQGRFWNVFWVVVLAILLSFGLRIVLGLILWPLAYWLEALITQIVVGTIITPYLVAVLTLVYYRLRQREETVPAEPAPEPEPAT